MATQHYDGCGLYYTTITDGGWDLAADTGGHLNVDTGTNGRWSGRCIRTGFNQGGNGSFGRTLTGSPAEIVTQFAFKWSGSGTTTPMNMVSVYEGTTLHADIRILNTGAIRVTRNGTQLGTDSAPVISDNAWAYGKLRIRVHDTAGEVELIIAGASIFSLTGQDTRNAGTGLINRIWFGPRQNGSSGTSGSMYWQDIWIGDTTGSAPYNGFHAEGRVHCLRPNSNGDTNDGTSSSGNPNYQNADETPRNDNTDYNALTAVGQVELYGLDNLPVTPTTIYGVKSCNMVAKDAAGSDQAAAAIKTNGTVYAGTGVAVAGATFERVNHLWELNPNTGVAFTATEINALQGGVKRVA